MTGIRRKLTFANVMSVIAVFLALTGVGYAAFKLPKNSVGPKQIRNGAINENKLSSSAKAALKGAKGDQGPPGPGATSFSTTLAQGTNFTPIATSPNWDHHQRQLSQRTVGGIEDPDTERQQPAGVRH